MNIKKLKVLMAENDMKPKDIANVLNIKINSVYTRLNGINNFKIDEIKKLADYFKVDVKIFLD